MTLSSTPSVLLSILNWYRRFGSKYVLAVCAGVMNAQLLSTRTVRSGDEPGKAYTSVMSDAGLSSTSGVSWWSEPRATLITPAVPSAATTRVASASRDHRGVEGRRPSPPGRLPTYG